jgi:hypothetical protein
MTAQTRLAPRRLGAAALAAEGIIPEDLGFTLG